MQYDPVIQDMFGSYGDWVNQANSRYASVLSGYSNAMQNYQAGTQRINKGYLDTIANQKGVGQAQNWGLQTQYQKQLGQQQQGLVSRGLGNSTLLNSAQRGSGYELANSQLQLGDQMQQRIIGQQNQRLGYLGDAQKHMAGMAGTYAELANQPPAGYPLTGGYMAQLALNHGQGIPGGGGGGAFPGGGGGGSKPARPGVPPPGPDPARYRGGDPEYHLGPNYGEDAWQAKSDAYTAQIAGVLGGSVYGAVGAVDPSGYPVDDYGNGGGGDWSGGGGYAGGGVSGGGGGGGGGGE